MLGTFNKPSVGKGNNDLSFPCNRIIPENPGTTFTKIKRDYLWKRNGIRMIHVIVTTQSPSSLVDLKPMGREIIRIESCNIGNHHIVHFFIQGICISFILCQ